MDKKLNHQANVVRILAEDIKTHPNADRLDLVTVGSYQAVTQKGTFFPGDLGVYIQPDSVVPQTAQFEFIWKDYIGLDGIVPEKRRRITVKRFRGEYSEGLLLPIGDFPELLTDTTLAVGDDVSEPLGITHYDPDAGKEHADGNTTNIRAPRRKYPRTLKGWFFFALHVFRIRRDDRNFALRVGFSAPVFDVKSFKNHPNVFQPGERVVVTEKVHGSNARYVFLDGVMYTGSRSLWKSDKSNCIWRRALRSNPWIEEFCREHEGFILYGEVTPTQGEGFDYGTSDQTPGFFLFDIRHSDGDWLEYDTVTQLLLEGGFNAPDRYARVPVLYVGPYYEEIISQFVDGPSTVPGARHMREGIVIKPLVERHVPGVGRAQLKVVSNKFLEKDSK